MFKTNTCKNGAVCICLSLLYCKFISCRKVLFYKLYFLSEDLLHFKEKIAKIYTPAETKFMAEL